jgi:hypothetical protein
MSEYSKSALEILRKPQATLHWYLVPLFLIFLYIITKEMKAKNWNVLLGAAALWGMDLFNEIWNSIVFHATGFAPVWGTPMGVGNTALLLLIGYNIEISIMFGLLGITSCLMLPEDKKKKIFGINNRIVFALVMTLLAVLIECFLNFAGILTWEYSWWSRKAPYLIFLIGYLPFFTMAFWVHDMTNRKKQYFTLGIIFGVDILSLIIFGAIGWM